MCANSDEQFEARVKARLAEIAAVEDTIEILNSDTSFEAFDKSVNSFLQVNAEDQNKRNRVVAVLRNAAAHSKNPALALIAVSAQLDVFTKIKEEIDKLIGEMEAQQADEVEHRDFCIKSLNENNRSQTAADMFGEFLNDIALFLLFGLGTSLDDFLRLIFLVNFGLSSIIIFIQYL